MFKPITSILLIFVFISSVSGENEPDLRKAKLLCEKKIKAATKELGIAKKTRNKEIKTAIKEYAGALERVKIEYTKRENLEKALAYKEKQEFLLRQSIYEFIPSDAVKKPRPEDFNPPENPKVVDKPVKKTEPDNPVVAKIEPEIPDKEPIPVSAPEPKKKIPPVKKISYATAVNLKDVRVSMAASKEAPTVDGEDIANFGNVIFNDKWWHGEPNAGCWRKGQTFLTKKSNVYLKGITYQMNSKRCLQTY